MADTIKASKNTFTGGLVMDFSPDATSNDVLTSALNATLLTFNGNEMLLQNDMGNGRVETARLPEGYIPVGTCEFGDIIYIVSYNPLTNKSLIGCFPSPERNVSSEETGSMGQSLLTTDFLVLDSNKKVTGELVATSCKKILYDKTLNPGDKFIIYNTNNTILSSNTISDMGNTSHIYGSWPKMMKIHVISIEDSGKITYLDDTLRWYDLKSSSSDRDYFITTRNSTSGKVDIDSYRNLLSSGYSIFQSKISGKLGLLIELEKITGFSCTYDIYSENTDSISDGDSYKSSDETTETTVTTINKVASRSTASGSLVTLDKFMLADPDADLGGTSSGTSSGSSDLSKEVTDTEETPTLYTVTVQSNSSTMGTILITNTTSSSTSDDFSSGDTAKLTAEPNLNYEFAGYYYDSSYSTLLSTNSIITFTVTLDILLYAKFIKSSTVSSEESGDEENDDTSTWTVNTTTTSKSSETSGDSSIDFRIDNKIYHIYWTINWTSDDDNVRPVYIVLTKSKWSGSVPGKEGHYYVKCSNADKDYDILAALPYETYDYSTGEGYFKKITGAKASEINYGVYKYSSFLTSRSYEAFSKNYLKLWLKSLGQVVSKAVVARDSIGQPKLYTESDGTEIVDKYNYFLNPHSVKWEQISTDADGNPVYGEQLYYVNNDLLLVAYENSNEDSTTAVKLTYVPDDILNTYFKTSVYKYFTDVTLPYKQIVNGVEYKPDLTNLIYNYEITPAMAYGLLREYSSEGYIDFSKINSGEISINTWKYYNGDNASTLTLGMDAYVEDNMGIAEVVIEFYDNLGFAASYRILNKASYAGKFTEIIPLNGSSKNFNMSDTNYEGNTYIHIGELADLSSDTEVYYATTDDGTIGKQEYNDALDKYIPTGIALAYLKTDSDGTVRAYKDSTYSNEITNTGLLYKNDAGTLYSNVLYLVKIVVKYCPKNSLGTLDDENETNFKYFYKWYWTNNMYNQYYYQILDFTTLPFKLVLDANMNYTTNDNYYYKNIEYKSPKFNTVTANYDELYKGLSANVQVVSNTTSGTSKYNLEMDVTPGLLETYNTFSLCGKWAANKEDSLGCLNPTSGLEVVLFTGGATYVENINELPDILHGGESSYSESSSIQPILNTGDWDVSKYGEDLKKYLKKYDFDNRFYPETPEEDSDLYDAVENYKNYKNQFNITYSESTTECQSDIQYLQYDNTYKNVNGKKCIIKSLYDIYKDNKFMANVDIIHFSKYYPISVQKTSAVKVLTPLIYDESDLEKYNLVLNTKTGNVYIKNVMGMLFWDDGDDTDSHLRINKYPFVDETTWDSTTGVNISNHDWGDKEDQSQFDATVNSDFFSNFPKGFSLFSWSSAGNNSKHTQYTCFNKSNLKAEDFSSPSTVYSSVFDTPNLYWYHDHNLNTTCRCLNYTNSGEILMGISYTDDVNGLTHIFNTYLPVYPDNALKIKYKGTMANDFGYPEYIGNIVASILAGMYRYNALGDANYTQIIDLIYLVSNYTLFTKDFAYLIQIKNGVDPNELILLLGLRFSEYLSTLKNNSNIDENVDIDYSNVTLNLQGSIKNTPLLFKLDYLSPNINILAQQSYLVPTIVKTINGKSFNIYEDIVEDKLYLYEFDGENEGTLKRIGTDFSFKQIETLEVENGILNATFYTKKETTKIGPALPSYSQIYKIFTLNSGDLKLLMTLADASNSNRYSIVSKEEDFMRLSDLNKTEILIPFGKLID